MSGETAKANTCVFWDVDDCPITQGLDPNSIYKNIKSALADEGYGGNLEFKAYCADESFADEFLLDAGMTFVHKVTIHVRQMLFDMYEWALVNPEGSNLLLISKFTPEDQKLVVTVGNLALRGYNVLLAPPDILALEWLHFTPRSVWLWTSLSKAGSPIEPRGTKRKSSADTVTDSENSLPKFTRIDNNVESS